MGGDGLLLGGRARCGRQEVKGIVRESVGKSSDGVAPTLRDGEDCRERVVHGEVDEESYGELEHRL